MGNFIISSLILFVLIISFSFKIISLLILIPLPFIALRASLFEDTILFE